MNANVENPLKFKSDLRLILSSKSTNFRISVQKVCISNRQSIQLNIEGLTILSKKVDCPVGSFHY